MSMQSLPKTKSRKSRNESVDIISNLPISIMSHILSFLPTVDAFTTCILSTKWKNIWTTLSTLTFNDTLSPFYCDYHNDMSKNIKFAGFVNRVLHFPRDNSLFKFSLHCRSNSELYGISAWISISIMKGVRELHLSIIYGESVQLPECLYSSTTLEVLKLDYGVSIKMPPVVYLPNLTRMELTKIDYKADTYQLISSCTSLHYLAIHYQTIDYLFCVTIEELHLSDVLIKETSFLPNLRVPSLDSVTFRYQGSEATEYARKFISSFPSLDSLVVVDVYGLDKLIISSSTLRDLKVERPPDDDLDYDMLELELDAPALQHLNLGSWRLTNVCIKDLSSLIDVVVRFEFTPTIHDRSYNRTMCTLFHGFCNVKVMYLSWLCMRGTIPDHKFPKFFKLTELTVEVECTSWPLLLQIINNSNALEDLVLVYDKDFCEDADCGHIVSWKHPEVVPECLFSSFRRLQFYGFQGFEHELAMVEYLLKNVEVMRRMVIEICPSLDKYIKMNLHKKLLKFRRGSEECEMTVCSDGSMSKLRSRWRCFFRDSMSISI